MLRQVVFDEVVNYAAVQHAGQAVHWTAAMGRYESAGDMSMLEAARRLAAGHTVWGDIMNEATIDAIHLDGED